MSDPNKMRNREFHSYASTTALRVLAILTSIAVFIGIVSTISTSKSDSGSAIPVIILALLVAILLPASMHVFLNMSDDLKLTGEVIDDLEEEIAEQKAMLTRYMNDQHQLMTRLVNMQQGLNKRAFPFFEQVSDYCMKEGTPPAKESWDYILNKPYTWKDDPSETTWEAPDNSDPELNNPE